MSVWHAFALSRTAGIRPSLTCISDLQLSRPQLKAIAKQLGDVRTDAEIGRVLQQAELAERPL